MQVNEKSLPITALALTERQLADWRTLHKQLDERNASQAELLYCEKRIDALVAELKTLQGK